MQPGRMRAHAGAHEVMSVEECRTSIEGVCWLGAQGAQQCGWATKARRCGQPEHEGTTSSAGVARDKSASAVKS